MYLRSLPVQVIEQMTSVEYMLAQDLTKSKLSMFRILT